MPYLGWMWVPIMIILHELKFRLESKLCMMLSFCGAYLWEGSDVINIQMQHHPSMTMITVVTGHLVPQCYNILLNMKNIFLLA